MAALRAGHTRSIEPARARATEILKLERTLSDLVNQACRTNHLDSAPDPASDSLRGRLAGALQLASHGERRR